MKKEEFGRVSDNTVGNVIYVGKQKWNESESHGFWGNFGFHRS